MVPERPDFADIAVINGSIRVMKSASRLFFGFILQTIALT